MRNIINVLVVDDSPLVRSVLKEILNADEQINVIATVEDPYQAAKVIKRQLPDVITLDIEMPRMNGLTFLKKIMEQRPIPVVIISSLSKKGAAISLKALELGAVEVIEKPRLDNKTHIEEAGIQICDKVKAASVTKLKKHFKPLIVKPKLSADVVIPKIARRVNLSTETIIAVGASTGGTEAIKEFLLGMPAHSPGIVIVQHMPEKFTYSFAERLNQLCPMQVKEAQNGDFVERGKVLIAPGNYHMLLRPKGTGYTVEIKAGQLVNRHRPSVDVLFRSVALTAGRNATGILLTGMGDDGAKGIGEIKEFGGYTIAQDEESSVVYGMPKEALKYDKNVKVLPLSQIAQHVMIQLKI